jgi:nucleotide-binding universal stress UspA family protein
MGWAGGAVNEEAASVIERVVVPVDFTTESDRALLVAPVLARWSGARVELVTVTEQFDRADAEARLTEVAELIGNGTKASVLDSDGPAEEVLLTELRRDAKALWCVGSHVRSKWTELLIESVSEDLVREAHVPVVLVGPNVSEPPSGRIVAVALDGTGPSEAILPVAADLGAALGMTIRLLQVADLGADDLPTDAADTGYLARVAEQIPSVETALVDYDVLHGDHPARDLADYVTVHHDVGMIALATRGLSGRARLLHGSTALDLAHRARVPVLILHQV